MKKLSLLIGMLVMLFTTSCRDIVNSVLDVLPPFDVPFTTTLAVPFANVSTTTYTRTPEIPMNIDLDAKIKQNNPNLLHQQPEIGEDEYFECRVCKCSV